MLALERQIRLRLRHFAAQSRHKATSGLAGGLQCHSSMALRNISDCFHCLQPRRKPISNHNLGHDHASGACLYRQPLHQASLDRSKHPNWVPIHMINVSSKHAVSRGGSKVFRLLGSPSTVRPGVFARSSRHNSSDRLQKRTFPE